MNNKNLISGGRFPPRPAFLSPSVGTFRSKISERHCRITTSPDHSTYSDDEDIEENIDEISVDDKENE